MTRTVAHKTLIAIDNAIAADGGALFRVWQGRVLPHLNDAYRGEDDKFRSHMGASTMGNECGRAVWYGFRWASEPIFTPRILRLFNRGHLEEGRFIALLLMIGVEVLQQDEHGNQFRIADHAGHYGGSGDGLALSVPDLPPGQWAVLEFKTHSEKSFNELRDKGVRDAKWDHFVQVQQYMYKFGIPSTLYMAVNKNTDDLYAEVITLDSALAEQFIERAGKIIWMDKPPEKLPNASAGWFKCKFCDHRTVCHLNAIPAKNCRTCKFSEPTSTGQGQWKCRNAVVANGAADIPIDKITQLEGCSHYELMNM